MTDELFAAVYAAPDLDAPRVELAKVLLESSDPRGEFITLQLSPEPRPEELRRARALLRAHAKEWLAPLNGALVQSTVEWDRGFPAAGRLAFKRKRAEADALIGLPALATLRTLDVGGGDLVHGADWLRKLLFESPLRSLRELRGVFPIFFTEFLESDPPWALETLHMPAHADPERLDEVAAATARGRGLPRLTELQLSYAHQRPGASPDDRFGRYDPEGNYGWLWLTPFGRRIETLRMNHGPDGIVPWLPVLTGHADQLALKRVVFFAAAEFVLERTPDGWTRLTGVFPEDPPRHLRASLDWAIELARAQHPLQVEITNYTA